MSFPYLQLDSPLKALQDRLEGTLTTFHEVVAPAPIELCESISFISWLQKNFKNLFELKRKFRAIADLSHNTEKYI